MKTFLLGIGNLIKWEVIEGGGGFDRIDKMNRMSLNKGENGVGVINALIGRRVN
jgi:hypothetical protein